MVICIGEDECCNVSHPYVEWVFDSTAFYHVTPRKELFTSYKAGNFGRVKMGNNSYANIVGIGDVCVETNTGYTLASKNVRHMPDMSLNLISTHILDKEGYVNYFGDGKWRLSNPNLHFSLVDTTFCLLSCLFACHAYHAYLLYTFSYALRIFSFHFLSTGFLSSPLHVHTWSKDAWS